MAKKHQKPWTKKVRTGYYVDIDATLDISEEMYISADDVTVVGGTLVFTQDGVTVCVIEPGKWHQVWHLTHGGKYTAAAPHLDDRGTDSDLRTELEGTLKGWQTL